MPSKKRPSIERATETAAAPPRLLTQPVFAQPAPTPDPTVFVVAHPSDDAAYKKIDELNREHKLAAMPFPAPRGGVEPTLTLQEVLGGAGHAVDAIAAAGQIVFHATGDCGSTIGPRTESLVTDKMVGDFQETNANEIPQFNVLLGDIVYSFGEAQYYYDQFYDPYRDYAAPILALAGNHDGMVAPGVVTPTLAAFLRNFCSEDFIVTPEAGQLSRTAQIQPGVFFTFEAPFVRIFALYSNTLEDPGVIANPTIGTSQLDFLQAAFQRVKTDAFSGALIVAHHHPPYTVGSRHGWSIDLLAQVDAICKATDVWPHAVLSGHAHNYQRFTRTRPDGTEIPYVVCGNGGHNVSKLSKAAGSVLRTPQIVQPASATDDQVVFENYDDTNYGYLRLTVTAAQLRIEYHPASDGTTVKTPDDFVTVDLATRKLAQFVASDLGRPLAARQVARRAAPPAPAKPVRRRR